MKILIVTPDFPMWDGGVAAVAEKLAEFLQRAGHETTVFTPMQTPEDAGFDQRQSYHVVRVRNVKDRHLKYLYGWWQLRKLLVPGSFDVALATAWFPYAPAVASIAPRLPLYLCAYGNDFLERRWQKPFWRGRMFRALTSCRRILAGSEGSAVALGEFWPPAKDKTIVVTPAVDPLEFVLPAKGAHPPAGPVLLTLARLVERKGQDMVISALPTILKEFPQTQYWIAGRGADHERLQQLVARLNLQNHVRFLGFIPSADRIKLYQQCTVYLMPSRTIEDKGDFEAFGITFLEANACGKPVIGGRSGGVADAVLDGVTGFLVDPHSPGDIAEKTLRLLRDPVLANQLGRAGRERIERDLNWEKTVEKILALLPGR